MSTENYRKGQRKQEEECAQAFLHWLGSQSGTNYELQRAEECPDLRGRWDFIARAEGSVQWFAIEVKELVFPQARRQFSSWSKFCEEVTKELTARRTIQGSFTIITSVPWCFNQRQSKLLFEAFLDTLTEVCSSMCLDKMIDIGPNIKLRFKDWPTEPATIDHKLWQEQQVYKIIHPPKELSISKNNKTGCSVDTVAIGPVIDIIPSLAEAVKKLFSPRVSMDSKPNEQLRDAKQKGASETALLIDSHERWAPDTLVHELSSIKKTLMSNIDVIYVVSVTNNRVKKVWP